MAVTIVRSIWQDDDGTGTTGTVINQALHTVLYNEIDGALAKVAQLNGGNAFTGNQSIGGTLLVTGLGVHGYLTSGVGQNEVRIANTLAGAGNSAALTVGNDAVSNMTQLISLASNYTPNVYLQPNTSVLVGAGAGGINLGTISGPIKLWTSYLERLRVLPTGEMCINTTVPEFGAQMQLNADLTSKQGLVIKNLNPANSGNLLFFLNSASVGIGNITQSSASGIIYGNTSDRRLKADEVRASDLTALRAVVVYDFRWKADGVRDRGVFAQELAPLFPRAVVAGTDETTDDGALVHPWMTDNSKLVPDLIVGWQQHDAAITELRAALAALKG